ncbi:MAG: transcriptional repressor [Oscillospiraceae bacterium]|nr:transcriptional repressor [Oscillospiraceae bacterium]
MGRPEGYNTKQRQAIFSYIVSLGSSHVTAGQIFEHFKEKGSEIGRATVYRHLEKLEKDGCLRRYTTDGVSGACYQQDSPQKGCCSHLHLKCEGCGGLQHLDCQTLDSFQQHIADSHKFKVNSFKTVLYGKCGGCLKESSN